MQLSCPITSSYRLSLHGESLENSKRNIVEMSSDALQSKIYYKPKGAMPIQASTPGWNGKGPFGSDSPVLACKQPLPLLQRAVNGIVGGGGRLGRRSLSALLIFKAKFGEFNNSRWARGYGYPFGLLCAVEVGFW